MAATLRTTLIVVVGVLLANAIESIRATPRGKGTIAVRAFEEEDTMVIEIHDDGREVPSDLRPNVLEPRLSASPTQRVGLPGIRDRLRRTGGELLVDSDPNGTTVRAFLPSANALATMETDVADDLHRSFKTPS